MSKQFSFSIGWLLVLFSFGARWGRLPTDFYIKPIDEGVIVDAGLGNIWFLLTTVHRGHLLGVKHKNDG